MKRSDCSTTEGAYLGLTRLVGQLKGDGGESRGMIELSASNMEKQRAGVIIRVGLEAKSCDASCRATMLKQATSDANK